MHGERALEGFSKEVGQRGLQFETCFSRGWEKVTIRSEPEGEADVWGGGRELVQRRVEKGTRYKRGKWELRALLTWILWDSGKRIGKESMGGLSVSLRRVGWRHPVRPDFMERPQDKGGGAATKKEEKGIFIKEKEERMDER